MPDECACCEQAREFQDLQATARSAANQHRDTLRILLDLIGELQAEIHTWHPIGAYERVDVMLRHTEARLREAAK